MKHKNTVIRPPDEKPFRIEQHLDNFGLTTSTVNANRARIHEFPDPRKEGSPVTNFIAEDGHEAPTTAVLQLSGNKALPSKSASQNITQREENQREDKILGKILSPPYCGTRVGTTQLGSIESGIRPKGLLADEIQNSGIWRCKAYKLIASGMVKSASLLNRGQKHGTRLVSYESLTTHRETLLEAGEPPTDQAAALNPEASIAQDITQPRNS